jgi:hypothetical protein
LLYALATSQNNYLCVFDNHTKFKNNGLQDVSGNFGGNKRGTLILGISIKSSLSFLLLIILTPSSFFSLLAAGWLRGSTPPAALFHYTI